jgi:peptidoglycan/LPS O-acetylase OafA/YrhL
MRRIPELDGLRCFAVAAVISVHFRPPTLSFVNNLLAMGWVGVDIFFAISGFLITSILLGMRGTNQPYRTFYARRSLRIFPPYYLVLSLICIVALSQHLFIPKSLGIGGFVFESSLVLQPILDAFRNLFVGHTLNRNTSGIDLHQLHQITEGLFVFWSLSVEEIFYLVWAPVVLRVKRNHIAIYAALPLVLCPGLRLIAHTPAFAEYTSFFFRIDSLCAGACMALLLAGAKNGSCSMKTLSRVLTIVFLLTCLLLYVMLWHTGVMHGIEPRSTLLFASLGYTLLAIASSAAVGLCALHSGGTQRVLRILRFRVVLFIGTISYMIYLIHIPVYVAVHGLLGALRSPTISWVVVPVSLGLTIALAAISWQYFERPILAWKDRKFHPSGRAETARLVC